MITYLICFLEFDTLKIFTDKGPDFVYDNVFQENKKLDVLVKSRRYASPNLITANYVTPDVLASNIEEQKEEIKDGSVLELSSEVTLEQVGPPANSEVQEVVEEPVTEPQEEVIEEVTVQEEVAEAPVIYQEPTVNYDLGNQIVEFAKQFVGNPYVMGGTSLTNGADCSGFTMSVFAHFGISIARTTTGQLSSGYQVSLDNIMPGDLVLSGYNGQICHSSLYIGNHQLVHALNENTGIVITDLNIMPIIAVVRVI